MGEKVGLVLEGGGAMGSYHLGAYKALMEIGYPLFWCCRYFYRSFKMVL